MQQDQTDYMSKACETNKNGAERILAPLFSDSSGRINLKDPVAFGDHRSGWAYCTSALSWLHNESGVHFDDFVEKRFSWDLDQNVQSGVVPYREPWVGVFHNPPAMPSWFSYNDSPQSVLNRPAMQESLQHCLGLYVLSDYHREWLAPRVNVPVESLVHPTDRPQREFSLDMYRGNSDRKLIQIGYWLRRMHSLSELRVKRLTKIWLVTNEMAKSFFELERLHEPGCEHALGEGFEVWPWVDYREYDILLEKNIAFAHFYDASANNTILECIVRSTPVLVNPLPAIREYLGDDYPFYFESLEEAADKAEDETLAARAHEYLKSMDKTRFGADFFRNSLVNSAIYQSLPDPRPARGYSTEIPQSTAPADGASFDELMRRLREQLDREEVDTGFQTSRP